VDPEHIAQVKRIMGIKPEASPYARLAEVYAIGSEEEEKMAPHLSCEISGVQCKALCDIEGQVSVLASKIYNKVQDHNLELAPTSTKLIMRDDRTIKPLGIACNINVIISGKFLPTDFFVIDAYHSNHYKIFSQMQHRKSVAKDPKMVAIVLLLPSFLVKCRCTCDCSNRRMQRVTF
jgi:hypothetical protein